MIYCVYLVYIHFEIKCIKLYFWNVACQGYPEFVYVLEKNKHLFYTQVI